MESPQSIYTIRVRGELDPAWSAWLEGLEISLSLESGAPETIISGPVRDQATLRGILNRLWDLNLELVGIRRS